MCLRGRRRQQGQHDEVQGQYEELQDLQIKDSPYKNYSRATIKSFTRVIAVILAMSTTVCLLFSQLTALKIILNLYELSNYSSISIADMSPFEAQKQAAQCYWQLLFILWIPNGLTFLRAVYNGLLDNTTSNPWPNCCTCLLMVSTFNSYFIPRFQYFLLLCLVDILPKNR